MYFINSLWESILLKQLAAVFNLRWVPCLLLLATALEESSTILDRATIALIFVTVLGSSLSLHSQPGYVRIVHDATWRWGSLMWLRWLCSLQMFPSEKDDYLAKLKQFWNQSNNKFHRAYLVVAAILPLEGEWEGPLHIILNMAARQFLLARPLF